MDPNQNQTEATPQMQQEVAALADAQITKNKKQSRKLKLMAIIFLVFAVVGMVFLAMALSSSDDKTTITLDEQLKSDSNKLGLAIINWNNGKTAFELTPENTVELSVGYIASEFNDPRTGQPYVLTTAIPAEGEMQYIIGGVCNADDSISQSGQNSNFAIRVLLEDTSQLHCIERSEVRQPESS